MLGVLSLLLALISPMLLNAIESAQLRSAKRELMTGLRLARNQAVISQRETTLHLNVQDHTMKVAGRIRALHLPDEVKLNLVTASQEQVSEYEGAIRFYPDGSSTGGQIRFRQDERSSHIDVNWLTGQVTSAGQ